MERYLDKGQLNYKPTLITEIMSEFILKENVLTDNVLSIPDKNKVFKGGYIAIIKEYFFQSAWSDREEVTKFRSESRLVAYLGKKYPDADIDFCGTCLE